MVLFLGREVVTLLLDGREHSPPNQYLLMTGKRRSYGYYAGPNSYQLLEARQLLAGISIESILGRATLVIDGTSQGDVATVENVSSTVVRATLNNSSQNFNRSQFERIRFLGRSGNDVFTNRTDIDSAAFGHGGNDILTGGNGHNWIQGGDGDDEITGGDKNDNLRGRAGNDRIDGGKRHDRLFGSEGNDVILGSSGHDFIRGEAGNDSIFGGNGTDRLFGGSGNDRIEGGLGEDSVNLTRAYSSFTVYGNNPITVIDNGNSDGRDQVFSTEMFRFTDVVLSASQVGTASQRVFVRPIILSNSDGSNQAEYFGNHEQSIHNRIDEIFAQADIDIVWEDERYWNNSFANVGNGGPRPGTDLREIVENGDDNGLGSPVENVIDLYFVEVAPGFGDVGENAVNGLAFISAPGIAVHVGDNVLGFAEGRDAVARIVSHEIGHNLGLVHVNNQTNVMHENAAGDNFTQSQTNQIRNSNLSIPI